MVPLPVLRGYYPKRIFPGALHVPPRDFRRALFIPVGDGIDQLAMLFPRELPFVEPEHIDPGQQTQPVVNLQQGLADEAVAALARDHFVDAKSELDLLAKLLGARFEFALVDRK